MQICYLGTRALQKISAKNDTDLRKVEQIPQNKPVVNDMKRKVPRKPPRKTNMRTEVPKKTEENDMSTEAPKKPRNRRKNDMRTGHLDKNRKKTI
jgi:hypothetical protein